jgi:hypothetical protein
MNLQQRAKSIYQNEAKLVLQVVSDRMHFPGLSDKQRDTFILNLFNAGLSNGKASLSCSLYSDAVGLITGKASNELNPDRYSHVMERNPCNLMRDGWLQLESAIISASNFQRYAIQNNNSIEGEVGTIFDNMRDSGFNLHDSAISQVTTTECSLSDAEFKKNTVVDEPLSSLLSEYLSSSALTDPAARFQRGFVFKRFIRAIYCHGIHTAKAFNTIAIAEELKPLKPFAQRETLVPIDELLAEVNKGVVLPALLGIQSINGHEWLPLLDDHSNPGPEFKPYISPELDDMSVEEVMSNLVLDDPDEEEAIFNEGYEYAEFHWVGLVNLAL